jgi:dTDP-4-dehydrorhamnose reductase
VEDDDPNPLSWYGKTKLAGETAVRETLKNHAMVRTAWLYGRHGRGFLHLLLELTVKRQLAEIRVVDDQFGTPTWAWRLARQLEGIVDADAVGIFHATAEGWCSRYELARFFLEQMGIDCRIVPCPSTEFPTPAVRPKNSILENKRLKDAGLNLMRPWQEDMAEFVEKFKDQLLGLPEED